MLADGVIVDRVYDPYVQPLETELELRSIAEFDDEAANVQRHFLGLGYSLSERWAGEFYIIGAGRSGESLSVDAFELELKWQLTEQGEFAFDWGLLFEVERAVESNAWEVSTSLLIARDVGRWTTTANLDLAYEWGQRVTDELETSLHVQGRYRMQESFEPAIELHLGQDTLAVGPAVTGTVRLSEGKKFWWNLGVFAGLDERSPDAIVRLNLEYEF